jgi:hypothetical protein
MENARFSKLKRILTMVAGLLILKVTASVVLGYRNYFPPNFRSDFLCGRESYFAGIYEWNFYAHILSGPVTLVLGLILLSERFRLRSPKWHRALGKTQAMLVLCLLCPSGLWMAFYAQTGVVAAIGFSLLAVVTALCVIFGWRSAVKRRFVDHRRWMWRCFLLLCAAVIVRIIGGLATVTNLGLWSYQVAAWASWLVPLAAFELTDGLKRKIKRPRPHKESYSGVSASALSLAAMEINSRRSSAGISVRSA